MANKDKWTTLDCFIITQNKGAPEVAVAVIDAYVLHELAAVSRIQDQKKGYQRRINKRKLATIRRYVDVSNSLLPTAIVLATGEKSGFVKITNRSPLCGSDCMWKAKLQVKHSDTYQPFLVIDGQHRLEGIIRSSHEQYPVPVTILLKVPPPI